MYFKILEQAPPNLILLSLILKTFVKEFWQKSKLTSYEWKKCAKWKAALGIHFTYLNENVPFQKINRKQQKQGALLFFLFAQKHFAINIV